MKKILLLYLIFLLCSISGYAALNDADVYWSFDNNSLTGSDPDDLSGNGDDGNTNGATIGVPGILSDAFSYDGTDDAVDTTNNFDTSSGSWTISVWIDPNTVSAGNNNIFSCDTSALNFHIDGSSTSGAFRVYTGTVWKFDVNTGWTTGAWQHMIVSYDGTNLRQFRNAVEVGSAAETMTGGAAGVCRMGNRADGLTRGFDGEIDEFGIWGRNLSQAEINTLYNSGAGFNPYAGASANFTITATDAFDGSALSALSANVTLANGSSFYYTNSTGGFIHTDILSNATLLANITINTSNYFTRTILNQNLSVNLVTTLNQTATSFAAFDVFGNAVSTGNITINAQTNPLSFVWPLQGGTHNVTFSSADYYSITQEINVSALSTTTQNITGIFDTNFTINAIDFVDNGTINTFNATIVQNNVTFSAFNTTSNGNLSFGLLKSRLYNVTVRSAGYLVNNNTNYNISTNLTAVMRSATSSATFIDSNTSLGIINKTINLTYPDGTKLSLTTNENGTVSWVTVLNGVEIFGEYNITFDSQEGYDSPQFFLENITAANAPLNSSYFISPSVLNITIRDQATGNLINISTIVTIVGIGQFNVTGGNLVIQNGSIGAGSYTLYALATGYVIGQTVFDYDAREVENIDIYLIQSNASNTGTVQVTIFDEGFNTQLGADVRLLQYFSSSDSFIQVDQCFSNSNGECFFGVQLGTTLYKVTSTKTIIDETLSGVSSTDGEIFYIDDYAIEINMFNDLVYSAPDLLGFSLTAFNKTLINNISYLTGVWSDKYSNSHQVCIRYSYINNTIITPLSGGLNCVSGASGEVNVFGGYNLTTILATQSVLVELFVNETTGNEVVYWEEIYTSTKSFETQAGDLAPYVIIILFTTALALSLYLKSVFLFGVGAIIVSLASRRFFPTYFNWEIVAVMIILSFLLFYLSRKKEGNVAV
jgi:hypothetical protein